MCSAARTRESVVSAITNFKPNFTHIASGIAVLCLLVLVVLFRPRSESFPALPTGGFVGTISGVPDPSGEPQTKTLYVERISGASALLVVVFADGWKPQVIPLSWQSVGSGGGESAYLDPVSIEHDKIRLTLSGRESGGNFTGEVVSTSGEQGEWTLRPVSAAELKDPSVKLDPQMNLKGWLRLKRFHDDQKRKVELLRAEHDQHAGKLEKLEAFINNEAVLKERSRSRRDQLAIELSRVTEERKKNTQELKDAIAELGVLHRITKRGQTVELARRIAKRENKWYALNWSAEEDSSNVEEVLAERESVDLAKLNASVKKAEEVLKLRNGISQERTKIMELEAELEGRERLREAPAGSGEARPRETAPTRQRQLPPAATEPESKPWWKQWDSVL